MSTTLPIISNACTQLTEIDRNTTGNRRPNNLTVPFFTFLLTGFPCIALLLAAAGLGGILGHTVIKRTHVIGARIAIGATARDVAAMILHHAFMLVSAGAIVTLIAAAVSAGALAVGYSKTDPTEVFSFVTVLAVMLACAVPQHSYPFVEPPTSTRKRT